MAVIEVADTGVGIPPDQQALIFNRFYQTDAGSPVGGTGIGLALVRELVYVLNGTVSVASTVGVGTTFTVTLPVDAETWAGTVARQPLPEPVAVSLADALVYAPDADNDALSADQIPAAQPLLLLVDDNADVREYLRQVLTGTYRIEEAVDGRDGLTKAGDLMPDLIICDLMMPNLDGFGFCQLLKSQPTTDHIPVIMLTARADITSRITGFERGADEYIAKPFHPDELRTRVRNLLTQRRKLRDRFSRELRLKPSDVVVTSVEEQFLQRAIAVVEREMAHSGFTIEALADALNLSRMQLHRKLKAITNQSATEFVRHLRLQRAADLLAGRSASVSEVAYQVGFESLSYFTKSFREQFGHLPSDAHRTVGSTDTR